MIEQQATITSVDANYVWISVEQQSSCAGCSLSKGCGTGSIGKLLGHRYSRFRLYNDGNWKKGDKVILGIPDRSYLMASGLVYLLPLLTFFLTAAFVDAFVGVDGITVIAGVIGLFLGLVLANRLSHRRFTSDFQPKILRQIF